MSSRYVRRTNETVDIFQTFWQQKHSFQPVWGGGLYRVNADVIFVSTAIISLVYFCKVNLALEICTCANDCSQCEL